MTAAQGPAHGILKEPAVSPQGALGTEADVGQEWLGCRLTVRDCGGHGAKGGIVIIERLPALAIPNWSDLHPLAAAGQRARPFQLGKRIVA